MIMGHLIILQLTPNQSLTSHHYRRIHINRLDGIKRKLTPSKLSHLLCLMPPRMSVCDRKRRSQEGVAGGHCGHHSRQRRCMAKSRSPRIFDCPKGTCVMSELWQAEILKTSDRCSRQLINPSACLLFCFGEKIWEASLISRGNRSQGGVRHQENGSRL